MEGQVGQYASSYPSTERKTSTIAPDTMCARANSVQCGLALSLAAQHASLSIHFNIGLQRAFGGKQV